MTNINPDFPDLIGVNQFLEVPGGHSFQITYYTENPGDLADCLIWQVVKILFDGATSRRCRVERNLPHNVMLTYL